MAENAAVNVCPVERAGILDFKMRRLIQNPVKMLGPYLNSGMSVLDYGCGPGFFTVDMARLVGNKGRVVAADLQDGMLMRVKAKVSSGGFEERVSYYRCGTESAGLEDRFDFILLFYMLHEVPDQEKLLTELRNNLNDGGKILIVEPKFHVSAADFDKTVDLAGKCGFSLDKGPSVVMSRSVILSL